MTWRSPNYAKWNRGRTPRARYCDSLACGCGKILDAKGRHYAERPVRDVERRLCEVCGEAVSQWDYHYDDILDSHHKAIPVMSTERKMQAIRDAFKTKLRSQ